MSQVSYRRAPLALCCTKIWQNVQFLDSGGLWIKKLNSLIHDAYNPVWALSYFFAACRYAKCIVYGNSFNIFFKSC